MGQQEKTGYKVVCRNPKSRKRFSFTTLGKTTQYFISRRTDRPYNCGPLSVFDTRANAIRFTNKALTAGSSIREGDYEVWLVRFKESKQYFFYHGMDKYFNIPFSIKTEYMPHGAKFADWVKLEKKVWDSNNNFV